MRPNKPHIFKSWQSLEYGLDDCLSNKPSSVTLHQNHAMVSVSNVKYQLLNLNMPTQKIKWEDSKEPRINSFYEKL